MMSGQLTLQRRLTYSCSGLPGHPTGKLRPTLFYCIAFIKADIPVKHS